jgi:uncharacterized membrane-anchored protein
VLAFWIAYVLTGPLDASLGDLLSQSRADGGLGLGTTAMSAFFLAAIVGLVGFLTFTRRDQAQAPSPDKTLMTGRHRHPTWPEHRHG